MRIAAVIGNEPDGVELAAASVKTGAVMTLTDPDVRSVDQSDQAPVRPHRHTA